MVETQPVATGSRGEVRSIQYLRGLAALGVLVFHVAERAGGAFGPGAAGVDVFFVISGFIMWTVTQRETTPSQFLVRRLQRIAPLYWGVTLLVVVVALAAPAAFPAMSPTPGQVTRSLLFIPYRDPEGLIAPLVIPGWTLNYEMFFYVLFALTLLAPVRLRPWLLTAVLAGLVAARPLGPTADPLWATYTNPLLLEFAAGVWLGKAWSQGWRPTLLASGAMLVAGVLGFIMVAFSGVDVEPARALLWGVPALLIVAGAIGLERRGMAPALPVLHRVGDASYSLYLIHGLAISATVRGLAMVGLSSPPMILVCGLVVGVGAGLLVYRLVEQPLTRLLMPRKRRLAPRPADPRCD